ncbi:MAG: alkaline phosphatase family protein [Chloroflexi bacterium]|nr:alkaline phosphatase family protein [Chloroflexota bacterium]
MNGSKEPALSPSKGRVLIIGLDGATWQNARRWAEAGHLPTFRRLMEDGAWGALESVVPPSTPVAWSSFATGKYSGKHGLFDFMARRAGSYDQYTVNASTRDGAPLWQLLSAAGYRVSVFNVPLTYPPDKVNGQMISGFLTPAHAADASWPRELQAELKQAVPDFTFYPPNVYTPGQEAAFTQTIDRLNQATLDAVRYMMRHQQWDFFMGVFMGTDVIQHFLWGEMERGQGAHAQAILRCYQFMDGVLKEMLDGLAPHDTLIVMSDHGFGNLTHYFHTNAWLVERGYLKFKRTPGSALRALGFRLGLTPLEVFQKILALGLGKKVQETASERNDMMKTLVKQFFASLSDVDWNHTRAYSMGFGGQITVNLKGREPQGCVAPGDAYEAVIQQLTDDLRRIVDPYTGKPLVGKIYRREELFHGPHADQGADILFEPQDWSRQPFAGHEFASRRWLEPCTDRTGTHRMDGLLALFGPGIRRGYQVQGARIVDVTPTVLALLGVPIPEDMDGRVLSSALKPEALPELNVTFTQATASERGPAVEMSEEDQAIIDQHLRDLGYIG